MSLVSLIAEVKTKMFELDRPNTPPFEIGAASLRCERSAPVVIWVPQGERITGPQGQGGDGVSSPRPLFTRNVTVVAHLWDEDIAAVEALLTLVVRAVHALGWGSMLPLHAQWQTGAEVVTNWGVLLGVSFEWKIPITRAADTYAAVTSIPITGEIAEEA